MPRLDPRPRARLGYRAVSHGGRVHEGALPLWVARVPELLPPGGPLAGVLALGDLEAMVGGAPLGVAAAAACEGWAAEGILPPLESLGVLLTGDLHGDPELAVRGVPGDVRPVWEAFGARLRWVAGVPGNHDRFGGEAGRRALFARPGLHDLDAGPVVLDGLRLAGVGGIADPRPFPEHHAPEAYAARVRAALAGRPTLLVTHASPRGRGKRFPGCEVLAAALAEAGEALVVCGHKHWDRPVAPHAGGGFVLNVDRRAVLLLPEAEGEAEPGDAPGPAA